MALIVRNDLRLTKGKIASQCSHAAVMCVIRGQSDKNKPKLVKWLAAGQPKVVLKVENLDEINRLKEAASERGIIAEVVCDAGRTQVEPGTITVLGLGPDSTDKLDELIKELKLL